MSSPVIAFGQQPCGFFPKRFLVAKMITARRLQKEIGGQLVFFYHDADHDPRETKTTLRHRQSGKPLDYNFEFENKIQRKFSPLYLKRIPAQWHRHMANVLPNYVPPEFVAAFRDTPPTTVGTFCLEIYDRLGLLDGIRVVRSGDPAVRRSACPVDDYFVDVPYQNEVVRARLATDHGNPTARSLQLHEGGSNYITLPMPARLIPDQISPTRDTRLKWMQSVLHCTHYVAGAGEQQYLNKADAPDITFLVRDPIDRQNEAWTHPP